MRRGPRKTSFFDKVEQQRQEQMLKQQQQIYVQTLSTANAQNSQINNNSATKPVIPKPTTQLNTSRRVVTSAHEIMESAKRKLRRQAGTVDLVLILSHIGMILYGVYSYQQRVSLSFELTLTKEKNMNDNDEKNDNGANGIESTIDNETKRFDDICGMIDCRVDKNISIESKINGFWCVYLEIVNKFKTNENEAFINIVIQQLKIISKQTKNMSHLKAQFEIKGFRRMWQLCDKEYAKLNNSHNNHNHNNNNNDRNSICLAENSTGDLSGFKSSLNKPHQT